MELSPSSEAANCATIQELPSILWNPKVHYRIHKSLSLIPTLNQMNPVHINPLCISKIALLIHVRLSSGLLVERLNYGNIIQWDTYEQNCAFNLTTIKFNRD
jgi:hypothetical protein